MGEVAVERHRNAASRADSSAAIGLINLEKYRRSKSKASDNVEKVINKEDTASNKPELESSNNLSPDYKALWSEVHIQGDYDNFARSTAPGRKRMSEASPVKNENTPSPRPAAKNDKLATTQVSPRLVQQAQRQRRTRIKLSKPLIHFPVGADAKSSQVDQEETEAVLAGAAAVVPTLETPSDGAIQLTNNSEEKGFSNDFAASESVATHVNKLLELSEDAEEHQSLLETQFGAKESIVTNQADLAKPTGEASGGAAKQISKDDPSKLNFTPPVAAMIDFRPPANMGDGWFYPAASQNVNLSFPNFSSRMESHDDINPNYGSLSRQSALFLANYLDLGCDPLPNVVTSIVVKPILPPLRGRHENVLSRLQQNIWAKRLRDKTRSKEAQISGDASPSAAHKWDNEQQAALGPLRDAHAYTRRARAAEIQQVYEERLTRKSRKHTNSTQVADTMFDQVVRWRSKLRHCANPVMYRRITSPTLGEMALTRKLTDRLPTRQVRGRRPSSRDLQPLEASESWRKAPSHAADTSALFQQRANVTSTRPSVRKLGAFYNPTVARKRTEHAPLIEASTVFMDLPQPQMPSRKRRPVWQRMR